MAVMEFSQALMDGLVFWTFQNTSGTNPFNNAGWGPVCSFGFATNGPANGVHIMKGTPPTNFTALTTFNDRAADELILFEPASDWTTPTFSNSAWNLNTAVVPATASGTATWFWLVSCPLVNAATSATIQQQIIGSVGVSGSGADLTISDTAIVSGNNYRITSLIIQLSNTYTV